MSNELTKVEQKNLINANLKEIAKLCKRDKDISTAVSSHTIDNMKTFLVVYSRSQLTRVMKLTDALGRLEDELIEQSLQPENLDPYLIMQVMRVIQTSLNNALSMIKQVTSDESYINVIINNTKTINNTLNQYNTTTNNIVPVLLNQDSREKVRTMTSQILDQLNKIEKKEVIMENPEKSNELNKE